MPHFTDSYENRSTSEDGEDSKESWLSFCPAQYSSSNELRAELHSLL